jgi:hypothetical protein
MPFTGMSHNDAFQSGVNHVQNAGKANETPISPVDEGLQADSARWNELVPHGVTTTGTASESGDDTPWQAMQRTQGGYAPGAMPEMQDQLAYGGADQP